MTWLEILGAVGLLFVLSVAMVAIGGLMAWAESHRVGFIDDLGERIFGREVWRHK